MPISLHCTVPPASPGLSLVRWLPASLCPLLCSVHLAPCRRQREGGFSSLSSGFSSGAALQSIEEGNRQVDRSRYVPIFLEPTGRVDESAFEKATQKSADVIREHPDSKWVDDALLLIGKSHFYQQNYVGAAQ